MPGMNVSSDPTLITDRIRANRRVRPKPRLRIGIASASSTRNAQDFQFNAPFFNA